MRKYLTGAALVAISLSIAACNKAEPANEAVTEEPLANEAMDANMDMGMDANAVDANATADANAADADADADANATDANAAE